MFYLVHKYDQTEEVNSNFKKVNSILDFLYHTIHDSLIILLQLNQLIILNPNFFHITLLKLSL